MKRNRGFTIVEVMVVCGIIMVLAAMAFPVYSSAKQAGQVQASLGRLHQLQLAVAIYRVDNESVAVSKSLPPYDVVYGHYLGFGVDFFKSPCGYRAILPNIMELGYQYNFSEGEVMERYWNAAGELGLLFIDPSCNASRDIWVSPPALKRGLAVRLNGQLLNKYKRGEVFTLSRFFD